MIIYLLRENYVNISCYMLFVVWGIFSIVWIRRLNKAKNPRAVNPYLYEAIPSVFTTIGVFGTFVGIFMGLQDFDTNKITESIPTLLEGLKTAFLTSIIGLILSFIFGRCSQHVMNKVERKVTTSIDSELSALKKIIDILQDSRRDVEQNAQTLNTSLTGMLAQIQGIRSEQVGYAREAKENAGQIVKSMDDNNRLLGAKFDTFAGLLAKNNTEALVNAMKESTRQFNEQMTVIIEKLVHENFQELNSSVRQINQWQKDNKEMIAQLTGHYATVSGNFNTASSAIREVTVNTAKLTDENSHLARLIKELRMIMIEDDKYSNIINQLTATIDTLKTNTDAFDATIRKLNDWVGNQLTFGDSISKLLTKMEDVQKYKIETVPELLDAVNAEFYERLNNTLQNLDTCIQRMAEKNNRRLS